MLIECEMSLSMVYMVWVNFETHKFIQFVYMTEFAINQFLNKLHNDSEMKITIL